ncbi:hypothetical protein [Candidatus Nitrososphaera sp. FF02]|uniref:hypothetical protein n=1 Tax=Candidatus Nitrososphaera sp. FF02 TaxID=3398226 RepID=UPI0039E7C568
MVSPAGLASMIAIMALFATPAVAAATPKTTVIVLLDSACKMQGDYSERFSDSYVVCREEKHWKVARENFYGFEKYYAVIYVTQDNQHVKAASNVYGQAWFAEGENYAYSVNNPIVIAHEKAHLDCRCHFTADGRHDHERPALL